ncbi:MAG: hypothetical protein O9306_13655 [Beijerinckiaceae bacterium]|jgi:hypothetical protein|nr:hypothetical protein [Beijerinckiaceae bacterium]
MSEGRVSPEILELIRRTSTISGCDSIYSLAPRGHRVGFYFQQRRATLLARALKDRLGEKLDSAKIAVIGAGITGVSFFVSLIHFGAKNVYLYESSEKFLRTGAEASHRLVHPNYNRWPMLGSMDIFTSLPVLNWWAGTGEQVTGQLKKTVESFYDTQIENRFKPRYRCFELTQRGPHEKMPVLAKFKCVAKTTVKETTTKEITEEEITEEEFDLAVLSVGFGDEACVAWGLEDYWTTERVPLDTATHKREARIFGTGDGALIDALRCCAKEPKDAWEIPLGLIARLRDEAACVLQEDKVNIKQESRILKFSPWEIDIQRHEESIRSASWQMVKQSNNQVEKRYITEEKDFYVGLIRRIIQTEKTTKTFLEERLKPVADSKLKPQIVGKIEAPFEPTSAPINKLLLAYLLETDRVIYTIKPDTESELKEILSADRTSAQAKIEICRYGSPKNFLSTGTKGRTDAVSVHVTSDAGTKKHEETDLERHLIDLLSGLTGGEYVYFDAMPHPLDIARHGHDRETVPHNTRTRFKSTIEDFAQKKLAAHVILQSSPPKWVIQTEMTSEKVMEQLRMLGGIDGVFCGAPIVLSRTVTAESVRGEGF